MKHLKYIFAFGIFLTACSENKTSEDAGHDSAHIGATVGPLDLVETLSEADSAAVSEEPAKTQKE